jgi:hypothetical protein
MIHYQLRCSAAHEFDAWFRDSAAYEDQAGRGLLECPHCGERQVARALMAPAVPRRRRRAQAAAPEPAEAAPAPEATPATTEVAPPDMPAMPDHVRAVLQRMRSEVERRCEYVGGSFAAEARRIHEGESARRGIYGEATPDEAAELAEDGIEVAQIPWLPRADA